MEVGQILRTRTDPAGNAGTWKAFDTAGGTAITTFGQSITIGTYAATERKFFTAGSLWVNFYKIRLLEAVTYKGKSYQYVYMEEGKVYAYSAEQKSYFARSAVNVRSSPSSTSVTNKIGSIAKGVLGGTSDGTEKNGFLYVKLATPMKGYTYGFIAKTLLEVKTVTATPTTPTPSGSTTTTTTSETPTTVDKVEGVVERAVGEKGVNVLKWALLAGMAALVGYIVYRVTKK